MKCKRLEKALGNFKTQCGIIESKLQPRISFGEVSVDYYPGDGLCAMVNNLVVPIDYIPSKGEIDEEWWEKHAI